MPLIRVVASISDARGFNIEDLEHSVQESMIAQKVMDEAGVVTITLAPGPTQVFVSGLDKTADVNSFKETIVESIQSSVQALSKKKKRN